MKANGFAEIFDRPVWGEKLPRFTKLRDDMVAGEAGFSDAERGAADPSAYAILTRAEKRAVGERVGVFVCRACDLGLG